MPLLDLPREVRDARRLLATPGPHVHFVRETLGREQWFFFDWLARTRPALLGHFRHSIARSPLAMRTENTGVMVSWLQDPVRERNPRLLKRLHAIEARHAEAGIRCVNRADALSNAIKSHALETLRAAGFHCAKAIRLDGPKRFDTLADRLGLPFIVRNDQGHGGKVHLVSSRKDFDEIVWLRLPHPVALQYIETKSPDGYYRKYRYVLLGHRGAPRHVVIAPGWCVHAEDRVRGDDFTKEEIAYTRGDDPHHDTLDRARETLGLDYVAFDYAIDAEGRLIVWEPNPWPLLWAPFNASDSYYGYQRDCMDRMFTMMLEQYFEWAGIPLEPAPGATR